MRNPEPVKQDLLPVALNFVGAKENPRLKGMDPLPGKSHYYRGKNPQQWQSDVPQYAKLRYEDLYSGIDVVFYGRAGKLEYDFVIAPGADPNQILLDMEGVDSLELTEAGDLVISIAGSEMLLHRPISYQKIDGRNQYIGGNFVIKDGNQIAFEVDGYEPTLELIIDPILEYSTFIGGSGSETAWAVRVHTDGTIYVAGDTRSPDFPLMNAYQNVLSDSQDYSADAFIMKLDPTGTTLLFSTYFGGDQWDYFEDICLDGAGNVYAAGITTSSNCPTTLGVFQTSLAGTRDGLVVKMNAAGGLVWSTLIGGHPDPDYMDLDWLDGIALGPGGEVVVVGSTVSPDFPLSNPLQAELSSGIIAFDGVVVKLDPSGSSLLFSTYFGGSDADWFVGVDVDDAGDIYTTGMSNSVDYPVWNAFQGTLAGARDAVLTKLSADGSLIIYSTYLGGSRSEEGYRVMADSLGQAHITGYTHSIDFPVENALQSERAGDPEAVYSYDTFITKFASDGSNLIYSTYFGGCQGDDPWRGFDLDVHGNIYLTGNTYSYDFPVTDNAFQSTISGTEDGFVIKVDPTGSTFFSSFIGGSSWDRALDVAASPDGGAVVVGYTCSTDFPVTTNALQPVHGGSYNDAFLTKLALADVRMYDTPRQMPFRLTKLLKDINLTTYSSDPRAFVEFAGEIYCLVPGVDSDCGLWKINPLVPESAQQVKSLNISTSTISNNTELVEYNGKIYFVADDGINGYELWSSDGTEAGTTMLKNINTSGDSDLLYPSVAGDILFFTARDQQYQYHQIWCSDGTESGTKKITTSTTTGSYTNDLAPLADCVLVSVYGELYKIDYGTLAISLVKDLYPGSEKSSPYYFEVMDGVAYFSAQDPVAGRELWRSDGTPEGTYLLKDIHDTGDSNPMHITAIDGLLYFSASDAIAYKRLYVSDGTAEGTGLAISGSPDEPINISHYIGITAMNGKAYIIAGNELWVSQGTDLTTYKIEDFISLSGPQYPTVFDNRLYFISDGELYQTDGSIYGMTLVEDIYPGPNGSNPKFLTPTSFGLVFTANSPEYDVEPWITDGTNTHLLADIGDDTKGSNPSPFVASGGLAYFPADDGVHGRELWASDGTAEGTNMVVDLYPGIGGGIYNSTNLPLIDWDGVLMFSGMSLPTGKWTELWRTEGSESTTWNVAYPDTGSGYYSRNYSDMLIVGNTLFFAAPNIYGNYHELWKSDGTAGGTIRVAGMETWPPYAAGLYPSGAGFTEMGGDLYFIANDGQLGFELWKTNGQPNGTTIVRDIWPGNRSGLGGFRGNWAFKHRWFATLNNEIYFIANDGISGYGLWKSDGSTNGTVPVMDCYPDYLTEMNGLIYFNARTDDNVVRLYVTDGTDAGTHQIDDIDPDPNVELTDPIGLVPINNVLYFEGKDVVYGKELWKYDPLDGGAIRVADISPGSDSSYLNYLTDVDGTLFFHANNHLWCSDGTTGGTVEFSSAVSPANLTNIYGTLFFRGSDPHTGSEPWIGKLVVPAATPAGQNVSINPVDMTSGQQEVTVEYRTVMDPGTTIVSSSPVEYGEEPPAGFMFGDPAVYFEIETTALYDGIIHLCFDYSAYTFADETNLKLLHSSDGITWTDITVSLDTVNDIICGETTSFSQFAIVQDVDWDDDALVDWDEIDVYGTNPYLADTDVDGLLDGTEVEIAAGTGCPNPLDPDSDFDGLTDGFEVLVLASDPCNTDSDGDGIEDLFDGSPTDPGGTDPSTPEGVARSLGDWVSVMPLYLFIGPNDNSIEGRRSNISTRLHNAAKALETGDVDTARDLLEDVLVRVDNDQRPKDWMYESESQKFVDETIRILLSELAY